MLSRVYSLGLRGVTGYPVLVELDLANGLPGFTTVGLPGSAVRESRDRVASAVRNSGYRFPQRRITVNLAPAQSRKEGTQFDLPIALAVLAASGQIPERDWEKYCFVGELALDGSLRPVPGVLSMALRAKAEGFSAMVVPAENAAEARSAGISALCGRTLREVADFLSGAAPEPRDGGGPAPAEEPEDDGLDLADVKGQDSAKRALELAAAGGHNLLLVGPPGAGKSMLARRLAGLLPAPSPGEALESARLRSACGLPGKLASRRPFRAPHHTASAAALIGGGPSARPGEVSLAHGGVLFLDELAEFNRAALEALRQPLEDGSLVVARAQETVEYPARFQLVAATNPCPCGWRGHKTRECRCTPRELERYVGRISGPLLDRIDLRVATAPLEFADWAREERPPTATSQETRARVLEARARQRERFASEDFAVNAYIPARDLRRFCALDAAALAALERAALKRSLSARSLDRTLRVARTAADLAGSSRVESVHVMEALQYRGLERLVN